MYKAAKPRGTKVELICSAKISTSFAKARQSRKPMQADDGEEASPPSSPTAPLRGAKPAQILIPLDCLRRFWLCRSSLPTTEAAASKWGLTTRKRAFSQVKSCLWGRSESPPHWVQLLDLSVRVAWRCDYIVDKKVLNSCLLKHLFSRKFSNQQNRQNPLETLCRTTRSC